MSVRVINRSTTTPPGSPAIGDQYIVGTGAGGAWATHDKKIAITLDGTEWAFATPVEGDSAWDVATDEDLVYNGSAWVTRAAGTGLATTADLVGLLDDKGNIDCSGNPNYPAASEGDVYTVSVAGKIGGASGVTVEVGDVVRALADNAGGTQASVGSSWAVIQANLVGALINGGALGTPSSGTLTNCTGLPFPAGTTPSTAVGCGDAVHTKSTDIASAATTDLNTATGLAVDITGTTTITAFGTCAAGVVRLLRFTGILTLTHHATSLILPGGANILTEAGDTALLISLGSGNWYCHTFNRNSQFEWFVNLSSTHTLADSTSAQPMFPSDKDTFTLPTGLYEFESVYSLSAMSGTSGNAGYDIKGGGTAVLGGMAWTHVGCDQVVGTSANMSGSLATTTASSASAHGAGTATAMQTRLAGTFRVTTAGTIIPSVILVTGGVTPIAAINSFFKVRRLGPHDMQVRGLAA